MMPTVDIHAGAYIYNMRAQAVRVKNLIIRGEKCSFTNLISRIKQRMIWDEVVRSGMLKSY